LFAQAFEAVISSTRAVVYNPHIMDIDKRRTWFKLSDSSKSYLALMHPTFLWSEADSTSVCIRRRHPPSLCPPVTRFILTSQRRRFTSFLVYAYSISVYYPTLHSFCFPYCCDLTVLSWMHIACSCAYSNRPIGLNSWSCNA